MAASPSVPRAEESAIAIARRRFRRVRWIWLLSSILIYCAWEVVDQFVLDHYNPLLGLLLNWTVIITIGMLVMLAISWQEEQRLAALETLGQAQIDRERMVGQLEALHAVARTVAHELNQPLAIIRGSAELMRDAPPAEPIAHDIEVIIAQTDRAAGLVRQLIQVTRYETTPMPSGGVMLDLARSSDLSSLMT
jgi:signal transduction histidine kinase